MTCRCGRDSVATVEPDYNQVVFLCEFCLDEYYWHRADETAYFKASTVEHTDEKNRSNPHRFVPALDTTYEYCPECGEARKVA